MKNVEKSSSAGTKADSDSAVQDSSVSQPIAKHNVMRRWGRNKILNDVISGLMQVPLPKEGKSIGFGNFNRDIKEAFRLARFVQWADDIDEMRLAHKEFKNHIELCVRNGA